MNDSEIEKLKILLRKFLQEYALQSKIIKIEYDVANQRFYLDYDSFGMVNTFYTVDEFIDNIVKTHESQFK
jgi:hypothetical protein